ncbi:MAG TPA: hypothetical protein VMZ04_03400 [Anaerolineae bacterium]|nr:hypothetical protein [Anaerolineae bacterium]
MNRDIIIYINSKYTDERDMDKAYSFAIRIERKGYNAVIPCIQFGRMELSDRCDAMFLMEDWDLSEEARELEKQYRKDGKPVLKNISELDHMLFFDSLAELKLELEGE